MSAYVWLVVMILIFVTILLYNVVSQPLAIMEPEVKKYLNEAVNETDSVMAQNALDAIAVIDTVWMYWPFFLLFGLIFWALVATQRREPVYEGY